MKKCNEYNSKFNILSRVKSLNKQLGEIKYDNCKTTNLFGLIIVGIIGFILFNIFVVISDNWIKYE